MKTGHGAEAYHRARQHLQTHQYHWLVTGVAGFIGSNLLETLLQLGQRVTGLDNFMTGHRANLEQVKAGLPAAAWQRFRMIEGDIRSGALCAAACQGVDHVLHQAALGSASRSVDDPVLTSDINIMGFLNILKAAHDARVRRVVYAAAGASYDDHPGLPDGEECIGQSLSPYAASKYTNELHASVFARCYGTESIGLRYFNIFGPRQDPEGADAAVIAQWLQAMIDNEPVHINGGGESSRDFSYVDNAVQANILASLACNPASVNQVYDVAGNARTSLNALYLMMRSMLTPHYPQLCEHKAHYLAFHQGEVRHPQADVSKTACLLGYVPSYAIDAGLRQTIAWFRSRKI